MGPTNHRQLDFDPIAEARRQWQRRWPGADVMAAATSLIRAQQIVMSTVERALKPFDLTFARYEALVLLHFSRVGRLPLGKIGSRLQVHPTSVTNAIDRLEKQGFVNRKADPNDRRLTFAEITPAGRDVVERATRAIQPSAFGLGGLKSSELSQLQDLLLKLRLSAGDFSKPK
jgi:DNA-binding MarR family transcriptional regulator